MEWDMLLAVTGIYILLIGITFHQYLTTRRILNLTLETRQLLDRRREMIARQMRKREDQDRELSEDDD